MKRVGPTRTTCADGEKGHPIAACRVIHLQCNYSAFHGYRRTPSAYSLLGCRDCGEVWRTKANYVEELRYAAYAELDARPGGERPWWSHP